MTALRMSMFIWTGLLAGGIGPSLLVWNLTTHPKGQQGNLEGFVLGLMAGGIGALAGGFAGWWLAFRADRRAKRLGLRGWQLDWPTAVVAAVLATAFFLFAAWYVWAVQKAWAA